MPVPNDSAKLEALLAKKLPHLPYSWLKWYNSLLGLLKQMNGGKFYGAITHQYAGEDMPRDEDVHTKFRPFKMAD